MFRSSGKQNKASGRASILPNPYVYFMKLHMEVSPKSRTCFVSPTEGEPVSKDSPWSTFLVLFDCLSQKLPRVRKNPLGAKYFA
jgi:hypothetical protein